MAIRYLTLIATTALLTATAAVAQAPTGTTSTSSSSATTSTPPPSSTAGTTGTSMPPATPPMNSTSDTTGTMTTGTGTGTTGATPGGATATTGVATTLQGQDAMFLQKAALAGREEIADAQLALQNAQRSETKSVAQMMLDDHRRANDELQLLASRKGWSLPASGTAESDQSRDLANGGKSDFDQRYITEEIRDHRDAISLFRAETSSGSDPDLRQFARDQLPALEHHLEMLQGANTQK